VVTNGSGSPRTGAYAGFTDEEMQAVRLREQRKAAQIGEYSCQIQLRYPSPAVKDTTIEGVREDLATITDACRAEYAYIHNLADKHDTHVGVALRSIDALRSLDPENRPQKVYGCEVWRDLDWMVDEEKVALPTSDKPHLASALLGVFDSQISGGKRYDLAAIGRRLANATFYSSHKTDTETGLTFAMDLTPLVADPFANPIKYVVAAIERFQIDVEERLRQFS